ncbi:hypothetical protein N172_16295 [Pantoea dispersa EGD-AAK13]|nr:hypothetical protein N172_16295 [Pantoea dispersa EGD-AAK13]
MPLSAIFFMTIFNDRASKFSSFIYNLSQF